MEKIAFTEKSKVKLRVAQYAIVNRMLDISLRDKIGNIHIRNTTKVTEAEVKSVEFIRRTFEDEWQRRIVD